MKKALGCRILTPSAPVAVRRAAHEAAGYKKGGDYLVPLEVD